VIVDFIRASYVPMFATQCNKALGLAMKHAASVLSERSD
jgi:hypothetical protein